MAHSNNVKKNTIYNTLKTLFGIIYPLITFPYITRVLLTDNVGKINFGNSIVSYISLIATLGVNTYAIRECSKVKNNKEELSNTASQIFSINIFSTLFAYLCLFILLVFAKPLENYRLLICIQSAAVIFTTLGADWLNTAMEDFKYIAVRTVSMQVIALTLLVLFIHKPEDYIFYAVISVLASSGAHIVNIFYRKKYCKVKFTFLVNIKKHLPPILLLFSLILSQTIYVNSDMTILGLIKGDHEVGLYSTSVKIYTILNTTIASIAMVVMPKLSLCFSQKNYSEINKLLKYALNYILVLGIPCICGLEVIAPHIINVISGEAYLDAAPSLRILGFALLFSLIAGWIGNMTRIPAGRESVSLGISIVSAFINIILNLILIPQFGLNAAALTTAISECFNMICGFVLIDRNIRIAGIGKMLAGPIIGGTGIIIVCVVSQIVFSESWIITVFSLVFSALWYVVIMVITKNEFFAGFVNPIIKKFKRKSNI